MNDSRCCSDRGLWDAWMSLYHFPAIMIADRLNLFVNVDQRVPKRAALAQYLDIESRVAEALVGVLLATSPPLLVMTDNDHLRLTELSRGYLLPTSPYYYGGVLRDAWLKHSVARLIWHRIKPADVHENLLFANTQTLSEIWGDLTFDRAQAQHITEVMHSHSTASAHVLSQYDDIFEGAARLLDVGGGSGCFSIELARRNPKMHCTLLDLAAVCDVAQEYVVRANASSQVGIHKANMFTDTWPGHFDVVLLGDVMHDWGEADCFELAKRSYASLNPGGRILIHEILWSDRKDGPLLAALYSLCMVRATTAGRQYTFSELSKMLIDAGFEGPTIRKLPSHYSLIEARRTH